ncbi:hypothetical protein OIU78_026484 [Salix suchowensis]|nr:hypothetical protein OIU78_026484 [Salix suchowensis]
MQPSPLEAGPLAVHYLQSSELLRLLQRFQWLFLLLVVPSCVASLLAFHFLQSPPFGFTGFGGALGSFGGRPLGLAGAISDEAGDSGSLGLGGPTTTTPWRSIGIWLRVVVFPKHYLSSILHSIEVV